jgi:hypothetical protein
MSDEAVKEMIARAAKSANSTDALKFSQAACNAANAMCSLQTAKNLAPAK